MWYSDIRFCGDKSHFVPYADFPNPHTLVSETLDALEWSARTLAEAALKEVPNGTNQRVTGTITNQKIACNSDVFGGSSGLLANKKLRGQEPQRLEFLLARHPGMSANCRFPPGAGIRMSGSDGFIIHRF